MDIPTLVEQINKASVQYRIGALQQLRSKLHRKRASTKNIFHKRTTFNHYAFHDGGRKELQFNVGMEQVGEEHWWRHGVAFSFEKGQTLPDPAILAPKVLRFNIWVRSHTDTDALQGFKMWHWVRSTRSEDRSPGEILEASIMAEAFVFLGVRVPESEINVHRILEDFDRLYQLYEFVESAPELPNPAHPNSQSPRSVSDATRTTARHLAAEIEVDLRHNVLHKSLVRMLKAEFPNCPVHPELEVAQNGRVDVAIETSGGFVFCEIKVAPDVRAAVRQAVGQLLEYAHWPSECRATKWWVVSEATASSDDVAYLKALRSRYKLPIYYRRIDAEAALLCPEI